MQAGLLTPQSEIYVKSIKVFAGKLLPFLKLHYFGTLGANGQIQGGYHAHKKGVIISLFARLQIFDEHLFENFTRQLNNVINQASQVNSMMSGKYNNELTMAQVQLSSVIKAVN